MGLNLGCHNYYPADGEGATRALWNKYCQRFVRHVHTSPTVQGTLYESCVILGPNGLCVMKDHLIKYL
jgi:hypothetical protein